MPHLGLLAAVAAATGLLSCAGAAILIPLLRRSSVLDRPNERSSHVTPMPRGGGIAVIGSVLLIAAALTRIGGVAPGYGPILLGAGLLAIVSWIDDTRGLSPGVRLLVQAAAIGFGMSAFPAAGAVFQGWLPPALDFAAAGVAWLWFVNLFNFMDGIDGLAGSEAAAIAAGLLLFGLVGVGADAGAAPVAAAILGAAIGFLVWNWAPARIFLGDVGSVPLGYLLGFLLLDLAAAGRWKIALILPLYFLADATITLCRRLLRRERIWQAHRGHFYQRAVAAGQSHAAVVTRVIAADLGLILCGWTAENGWGLPSLGAAVAIVGWLLVDLARR